MDAGPSSDTPRDARSNKQDNRERSNSTKTSTSIDYVRDGALAAHKRGLSGNLLSKLGFAKGAASPEPQAKTGGGHSYGHSHSHSPGHGTGSLHGVLGGSEPTTSAPTSAHDAEAASRAAMSIGSVRRSSTTPLSIGSSLMAGRSRKGSLRKNILRKGSIQRMETILSPRMESRMSQVSHSTDSTEGSLVMSPTSPDSGDVDDDYPTPRASYERERDIVYAAGRSATLPSTGRSSVSREGSLWLDDNLEIADLSVSASLSRSSTLRDNSTTDEDEKPPGSSSSNASSGLMIAPKRPSVMTDSYFPPQADGIAASLRRRPSPMKSSRITKSSPLSAMPLDAATPGPPLSPEMVDYGETEWWGWIILIATWVTFVVGMGSCFGAWSWAWDVGETPYAPPELEDDPTLPIVGYYPALIVLTGVMAWVWVIIAWVGMKYFKHAKMSGDDG